MAIGLAVPDKSDMTAAPSVSAALLELGAGSAERANTAYEALLATKFSRADESEADRVGHELTARRRG